jgi:hypothetical protein
VRRSGAARARWRSSDGTAAVRRSDGAAARWWSGSDTWARARSRSAAARERKKKRKKLMNS